MAGARPLTNFQVITVSIQSSPTRPVRVGFHNDSNDGP